MRNSVRALVSAVLICASVALTPAVSGWARPAVHDGFYSFTDGGRSLASFAPGDVLRTRELPYHLAGVATPLHAVQILYRSTSATGTPTANVTSVLSMPGKRNAGVVSYQSAYDSLNPEDSPSRAVAGDFSLFGRTPVGRNIAVGNVFSNAENAILPAVLGLGYVVNIPDTEGQRADFAAGPEYGMNTLDSLRAVSQVAATGAGADSRIGLVGYSGGAIASNWAASLAPGYAPDINRRLAGVAEGGVLVNPARNLRYVSGSLGWGGVIGMAVNGVARAYGFGLDKYTSSYGKQVLRQLSDASILNFFYPGLTWARLMRPQYADPNTVPEYVDAVNKLNMGTAPVPTAPMFIAQAANGILEGTGITPGTGPVRGIGPGDGVMIAGDVEALAHRYCGAGTRVQYHQYGPLSHTLGTDIWGPEAALWLIGRMRGELAPTNCRDIGAGNSDAFAVQRHAPGVR
ncbi:lipase family protein [Williamsia sterculiae]|uniref:Secretory lipase n=1 Tax=Williamsia sterculiae TaxID=1344003 RepID=A0A1N7DK51_9NOCA|nr:lipase family protein [Williamsia sterculiae]SIR76177.1 Secretory lipase [Williamsia sterculiae]